MRSYTLSVRYPVTIASTNRIANRIIAFSGNIASMTKASSPDEAIIIATRAPKLNSLWVYSETVANPPMHPGTDPSRAATITCPSLVLLNPLNSSPLDSMFSDSIIIIITTTSPVIRIEFLSISINKCIIQPIRL